jgi:hypothetical protein
MGIKKLSDLKNEIDQMISIVYSAKTYFNDNVYLLNPDTNEEKIVAENDLFIRRARYALGAMSIIQINKLFGSDNDDFSINKLLNNLLNNHRNSEWKDKISIDLIRDWKSRLNENSMIESIAKVNGLRNQYFAHSDRNPEAIEKLLVQSEEMESLLSFCDEILFKISVDVFNEYRYDIVSDTAKASGILKRLTIHVVKK